MVSLSHERRKKTYSTKSSFRRGKKQLRERSNKCISRYCNYAALVIILVALASYVVGKGDVFFGQFGIMVSIALLAIAAINDPMRK